MKTSHAASPIIKALVVAATCALIIFGVLVWYNSR